jgi:hypothetical protein
MGHKDEVTSANMMGGSNAKKGWFTHTWQCGSANLVYCNDLNLCKNNYYYALLTELFQLTPQSFRTFTLALLTPAPVTSTLRQAPLSPTTICAPDHWRLHGKR